MRRLLHGDWSRFHSELSRMYSYTDGKWTNIRYLIPPFFLGSYGECVHNVHQALSLLKGLSMRLAIDQLDSLISACDDYYRWSGNTVCTCTCTCIYVYLHPVLQIRNLSILVYILDDWFIVYSVSSCVYNKVLV